VGPDGLRVCRETWRVGRKRGLKKEEAHEGVDPRWKGNRKLADTVDSVSEALEAHFGGMASLLAPASGGSY
jgi:hypothetical protein